ncbi:MAG: ABC transporter permease [Desulfovibrio sp.]|nr:ABC transporter permease [Desulfovibrio sp.]|tara:strand:+ start:18293 stop:19183 length:891 start_codon:yes stop_codon:yes gene_type:complete
MSSDKRTSASNAAKVFIRLLPLLIPFVLLFLGGLGMAVVQSLGFFLPVKTTGGPFSAYTALLQPHFIQSALFSLWVALASTTLSVTIGAVLAYAIWQMPHKLSRLSVVYKIPLILPHISVAFIVLIFWSQSGVFASLAYQFGFIDAPAEFPPVIHSGLGLGMILAYVLKEVPFVIILTLAVLRRLDPRLIQTATMLGSSPVSTFRSVALPHMKPALHTAGIILFLYGFGAFDIPFLLSESSPGMLSMEVYNLFFRRDLVNRPIAMAILVCMFLFSLAFIVIYTRIASRLDEGERKL